jgi:hypothetical protein
MPAAGVTGLAAIATTGAIGTTSGLPIITSTSGVLIAGSFGTGATDFCVGNDSRLSDARTPTAHTQAVSTISDSTAVGRAFVTLTNPGAVSFGRINADNTVTTRTPVETRDDLGFVSLVTLATTGSVSITPASNTAFVLSLTGNVTLSVTGDQDGSRFGLYIRGQASGYTITWFAGIKWSAGAAPTIPTVSGRVLLIVFTRLASGEWVGLISEECY